MKKTKAPAPEQEVQKEQETVETVITEPAETLPVETQVDEPEQVEIPEIKSEDPIPPAPEQEVQKEQEPFVHTTTAVTTTIISTSKQKSDKDPNLVSVRIKYPEDYAGKKFFKDGDVKETSKEGAEHLIKKGIATLI